MAKNFITISILALVLASVAVSQTAPTNNGVSLSSMFPNLTVHLNIPNYTTPVNLSNLRASTSIHVSTGMGTNKTYLQVIGSNSLSFQNVNVVLSVTSGMAPFNSVAILGITPATRSGIYNITITATSGEEYGNTILHLHVFNPTNVTFLYGNDSNVPSIAEASQEMNMSMANMSGYTTTVPSTSTVPQAPSLGVANKSIYGYIAATFVAAAIAAVAFALIRRKR
ncbi:MAG TPA: hypothetical protein VMV00_01715 [Candidatus Baltobacteraceae bacterium]|nr:hypothetical protein [Candidatus Baltobacteraceae bacterium]